VSLLAERPRPVGVLARLAEARQPQTTKHLQTLERAGVVTSQRSGQRRIYALSTGPLRDLADALNRLADSVDQPDGPYRTFDRYGAELDIERRAAETPEWADGRSFTFTRSLPAHTEAVWRHLTEESLLTRWWAPEGLRISEIVFQARPGGRIVLGYRDGVHVDDSEPPVGRAEGAVEELRRGEHLAYRLSPLLPDGAPAFTAHITFDLRPAGTGTQLDAHWRLADGTAQSADFIAGIEIGFGQSLDALAAVLAADA
jgi:uncharacterized protein YndB with AHSA1/START domain